MKPVSRDPATKGRRGKRTVNKQGEKKGIGNQVLEKKTRWESLVIEIDGRRVCQDRRKREPFGCSKFFEARINPGLMKVWSPMVRAGHRRSGKGRIRKDDRDLGTLEKSFIPDFRIFPGV